jgi:hypothetical protein
MSQKQLRLGQIQIKTFSGGGTYVENLVNDFLKQNADKIEVISFQVVDNSSMSGSSSTDGRQVFYLMYRITEF